RPAFSLGLSNLARYVLNGCWKKRRPHPCSARIRHSARCHRRKNSDVCSGGIIMDPRINYQQVAPAAIEAMLGLSKYLRNSGLEESLVNLICLRASQINGCAFCLDMHWKDLKAAGEEDQR